MTDRRVYDLGAGGGVALVEETGEGEPMLTLMDPEGSFAVVGIDALTNLKAVIDIILDGDAEVLQFGVDKPPEG